ncbi:uncharacterized [Tachysurus ichikawai]
MARDEVGRTETARDEVGRTETARDEVGWTETARDEVGRTETVRDEVGRTETVRDEVGRTETERDEMGRTETERDERREMKWDGQRRREMNPLVSSVFIQYLLHLFTLLITLSITSAAQHEPPAGRREASCRVGLNSIEPLLLTKLDSSLLSVSHQMVL